MLKQIKTARGFTLLETLIAMVIMASAILLLANSWSASTLRIRKAQVAFEVSGLLERKMAEIDRDLRGKSFSEIPEDKEGDFGEKYPQYSWKLKSKKLEFPDISAFLSSREGGVDPMTQMVIRQITEQMAKSIKEVTVTLIKKNEKKDLEFKVTTYYVDYTKEPVLGVGSVQ
jgi:general secretion pathway protein I